MKSFMLSCRSTYLASGHDELVLIWETHGNPEVATWDNGQGYEAGGPLLTAPATKLLAKNSA